MRVGWNSVGLQLRKVVCAFLLLQLYCHECFSLNIEGLVLWAFRSRVEIDPYGALQNWDTRDDNPCNWKGVYCVSGRVEILNLRGLNLVGRLAPELGKLIHLKALLLSMNSFTGEIPKEIGGLSMLELLDLSSNNLSGQISLEMGELPSLKCLLLCGNNFESRTPYWIKKTSMQSDLKNGQNLPCDIARDIVYDNWLELQRKSSHGQEYKHYNLQTETFILQPVHDVVNVRRHLLREERNLPAAHSSRARPHAVPVPAHSSRARSHAVPVPAHGSGSFAADNSSDNGNRTKHPTENPSSIPVLSGTSGKQDDKSASASWEKWIYTVIVPATALILVVSMVLFIVYRRRTAVISPWKTGLSGQLQKAFITGVPKLNQAELEVACEYFSNIIITYPNCVVYKGTLSSGVEIAVLSTKATSLLDWSDRSELRFRNKIDTASRINHKNFINLLGYCQEEDPFMRMMVFEYAPNGTLFERLHVEDFEHLEWSGRMRIVMGITYCLRHMHNLNPPVVHPILQSSSVFITEDYAAKIADIGFFNEPVGKGKFCRDDGTDNPVQSTNSESNVYSFGILLLEIISGRMPISVEDGLPILDWAADYLKDKKSINSLVDPSLKSIKEDELEIICEVVKACIRDDPKSRPTMKEVAASLKVGLEISPQAAVPRLSPLWWAELEILSFGES